MIPRSRRQSSSIKIVVVVGAVRSLPSSRRHPEPVAPLSPTSRRARVRYHPLGGASVPLHESARAAQRPCVCYQSSMRARRRPSVGSRATARAYAIHRTAAAVAAHCTVRRRVGVSHVVARTVKPPSPCRAVVGRIQLPPRETPEIESDRQPPGRIDVRFVFPPRRSFSPTAAAQQPSEPVLESTFSRPTPESRDDTTRRYSSPSPRARHDTQPPHARVRLIVWCVAVFLCRHRACVFFLCSFDFEYFGFYFFFITLP